MALFIPHFLWLLVIQVSPLISVQAYQNVTLGSSLSTLDLDSSWDSPSGEFSFGFRRNQGDHFLLAIWFAKIPLKTIVWTANDGNPVQRGSEVQLRSNGVLSLINPGGTEVWKANSLDGRQVVFATMLNSGNFVLVSNDSTPAWKSFDHPTDTLLPGQKLDSGWLIISRVSEDNYRPGRFYLSLQSNISLVLYLVTRPTEDPNGDYWLSHRPVSFSENHYAAYWKSNTLNNGSLVLIFNESEGYIYLSQLDGSRINLTSGIPFSTRDFYHRATLDIDGAFRQYTYPKTTKGGRWPESWSSAWFIPPQDMCTVDMGNFGSGVCGFNSYCRTQNRRTTCECPPGYIYSDPSNTFGGCKQNFVTPSCERDILKAGVGYEMRELPSTEWKGDVYDWFKPVTKDWCKETCLNDCLCAAALISGGNCQLKKFPLSNGKLNAGVGGNALIKVGNSSTENVLPNTGARDNRILPGPILLGSSAFLNLLLLFLVPLFIYYSCRKKEFQTRPSACSFEVNLREFTHKDLEVATSGFKEEMGQGAFSTIYKGSIELVNGSLVAVKRLDKVVGEVEKEFKAELSAIGRANHKNLVRLFGFCYEGPNRLLVYEYMRNGTLAKFLFGSTKPDWSLRTQIAIGIARGLAYLHEGCSTQVIHCDLKPQNVFLDDHFTPRISDFGLAKILKTDQTRTTTAIRGTKGYVAPEWFQNVPITIKVDVYSFGIMLLEIICCRRNVEVELGDEDIDVLSDWVYEYCIEGKLHLLVENDYDANNDKRLETMVMVAIWCIQEDPFLRPSMKMVKQMLEGTVDVSMPPDPSSYMSSIG